MTIYGYCRVSSLDQEGALKGQINQLKTLDPNLTDKNIVFEVASGTNVIERPKFNDLVNRLKPGDRLLVTKLDRFSRSLSDAIQILQDLSKKNIQLISTDMPRVENDPILARLYQQLLFMFAEFETSCRKERQRLGIDAILKDPELRKLKYPGRKSKIEKIQKELEKLKSLDVSVEQKCRLLKISRSTYYRALKGLKTKEGSKYKTRILGKYKFYKKNKS